MQIIYSRNAKNIGSFLIRLGEWWAPWTHSGVVTPDGTVVNARPLVGVIEESLDDFLKHATAYEVVDIDTPHDDIGVAFARLQVGKGYDYGAVVRFISSKFRDQDPNRWECTELVEASLYAAGRNRFRLPNFKVTPMQSYMTL